MATLPKWTEERTQELVTIVGGESPVTKQTVEATAEKLGTTARSVSSKLRKMGFDVELASAKAKTFSDEQAAALADFVVNNSGDFTYGELAEEFEGGAFSAKQVQGKILSLELTEHIKPTPKVEAVKTYSDEEEAKFLSLVKGGAFIEDLAEALGRSVNSIRGKALSLLRSGDISEIPKQREHKATAKVDALEALGDISEMTVEAIATALDKTPRGIRTMLTRRGIKVADYDGAAKKEKIDKA